MTFPPSFPPPPQQPGGHTPPLPLNYQGSPIPADPADIAQNKIYAVFAYFGIFVLIPLLAAPQSRFARYHANQGLTLLLCNLVVGMLMAVPGMFILIVPFLGPCAFCLVVPAYLVTILTLTILGVVNAATGQMKPLPLIGGLFTLIK